MPTLQIITGVDTEILSSQPTFNFGTGVTIRAGTNVNGIQVRRFFVQPDLSALLALPGITITSAILTLFCNGELSTTDYVVSCYRMLMQWYAGVQNGAAPGAADGSTWNQRNANTGAPLAWGIGGAQSGVDYNSTPIASTPIAGLGQFSDWDITSYVQGVYASTFTDLGLIFVNDSQAVNSSNKGFDSYQGATPAQRPILNITYTMPGLLPKLMQYGQFSGGTL